jgi:antitoxin component YwqK of YwqJK toxin-antitoxin module
MKLLTLFTTPLLLLFFAACSTPNLPSFSSGASDKKVKKEYFTGGKVRSEFIMDDDTGRNGLLKKYGYNGHLTSTAQIRNAVIDGFETGYDDKGRMLWKLTYMNGKQHGIQKAFYPNGDLMVTYEYTHGLKHGVAQTYNQDGTVNKKAIYTHGKLSN